MLDADGGLAQDIAYTRYDGVGNIRQYQLTQYGDDDFTNTYDITLARFEGYKEELTQGSSSLLQPGLTQQRYDVNGDLIGLANSERGEKDRNFINDASGIALQTQLNGLPGGNANQSPRVMRQLVVNGQVLGRYGFDIDPADPSDDDGRPNFAPSADFGLTYQGITTQRAPLSAGLYTVQPGDTLQSIAQAVYGDSRQWWKIAQASGIVSASDLHAGQVLTLPGLVSGTHNAAGDYRPYDPTRVIGDTLPHMPVPEGDWLEQLFIVIVAVIVTIVVAWALGAEEGLTAGEAILVALENPAMAAAAAASGNLAGQVAANAIGVQHGYDWKSVALSAVGGALSASIPMPNVGSITANLAVRAALVNAATQGIGVVTGLQKKFDWRGVAAAAAGSLGASGISNALLGDATVVNNVGRVTERATNGSEAFAKLFGSAAQGTAAVLSGFAAGITVQAARGGRVSATQVAVDVFGNAIGESIAGAALADAKWNEHAVMARNGTGTWDDAPMPTRADRYVQEFGGNAPLMADGGRGTRSDGNDVPLTVAQETAMALRGGPRTPAAAEAYIAAYAARAEGLLGMFDGASSPGDNGGTRTYPLIPSVSVGLDAVRFGSAYSSVEGGSLTLAGEPSTGDQITSTFKTVPGMGVSTLMTGPGGSVQGAYGVFADGLDSNGGYVLREATPEEAIGIQAQHAIAAQGWKDELMVAGAWYYAGAVAEGAIALTPTRLPIARSPLSDGLLADSELLTNRPSGLNELPVIKGNFKGGDLAQHLSEGGPHGKTVYGAHRQDAFEAALQQLGGLEIAPRVPLADGIYEVSYVTGKGVSGTKTIYDPARFSDQQVLDMSTRASQRAWDTYIVTGQKATATNVDGVPFKTLWSLDKHLKYPTLYSHPGR